MSSHREPTPPSCFRKVFQNSPSSSNFKNQVMLFILSWTEVDAILSLLNRILKIVRNVEIFLKRAGRSWIVRAHWHKSQATESEQNFKAEFQYCFLFFFSDFYRGYWVVYNGPNKMQKDGGRRQKLINELKSAQIHLDSSNLCYFFLFSIIVVRKNVVKCKKKQIWNQNWIDLIKIEYCF